MSRPLADALAEVVGAARTLGALDVAIEVAVGRVLARPVLSRTTLPPWDNAGMDGYALRSDDIASASAERPARLRVLETIRAGSSPTFAISAGTAARVMTGAPVPSGADTVVRVEDTDGGESEVRVKNPRDRNRNVRPKGEDARAGDELLPVGSEITPWSVGALAAAGVGRVEVYRAPRVAILSTGDELTSLEEADDAVAGRKIIASNTYALTAMARHAGAEVTSLGIARDEPDALAAAMAEARDADLLITTGGVSVGAFDYARGAFESIGGTIHFWRIRMRPGAQLAFGTLRGLRWLGLPGNPASAVVTFEVFARPLIRAMLGHGRPYRRLERATLRGEVMTNGSDDFFLRAIADAGGEGVTVRLSGGQGSHMQSGIARANALLHVPAGTSRLETGATCRIMSLTSAAYTERWM